MRCAPLPKFYRRGAHPVGLSPERQQNSAKRPFLNPANERGVSALSPSELQTHRPLGLPEAETRFFLGCLAAQERPSWSEFYTSPLPAVAAAQARDVEHASERLAQAEAAGAQSRAALALAERAESTAMEEDGLDACCAARDNVCAAGSELRRSDDAIAEATASLALAKAPRNHPVNLAFSPGGSTALSQLVDTWQERRQALQPYPT